MRTYLTYMPIVWAALEVAAAIAGPLAGSTFAKNIVIFFAVIAGSTSAGYAYGYNRQCEMEKAARMPAWQHVLFHLSDTLTMFILIGAGWWLAAAAYLLLLAVRLNNIELHVVAKATA